MLESLLKTSCGNVVLIVDERMPLDDALIRGSSVFRVKPTIVARLLAEKSLVANVTERDVVLCFGNLPPIFRLRGQTYVFVQNRYLIEDLPIGDFPFNIWLRISIERLWFNWRKTNVDEFIVQTPTMKRLLEKMSRGKLSVRTLPFIDSPSGYSRKGYSLPMSNDKVYDFLYVASGEPHKNHLKLLDAWCLLAMEGMFPSLCLTLDEFRFEKLLESANDLRNRYKLKITNAGNVSRQEVLLLYKQARAAIYPSKLESFGLPLIEARQAGLPILASELDFVRDILDPEHTFDPESALSIARSVKRFLLVDEESMQLLDADQFIEELMSARVSGIDQDITR